jgi:hypothetical protein
VCDNINYKLTQIVSQTTDWLHDHNLKVNFTKMKIMVFHPYQKQKLVIDFTYNNIKLDTVDNFTLLGLTIDTHLNWKAHVNKISNKLSSFA